MSDSHRQSEKDRLAKLRETMSDADFERLDARFRTDPESISADELDFLYLVTREKILRIEEKARRKLARERGPDDPNSTK